MATAASVKKELRKLADPKRAKATMGFFKTGKGQYGEGDRFFGVTQPQIRATVKKFKDLPLKEAVALLHSPWHEDRMAGVVLMVGLYQRAKEDSQREKVVKAYLANLKGINNWDLVDLSAGYIYGDWLLTRDRKPLYKMAKSPRLWTRRVAVISTSAFIDRGQSADIRKLSAMLLDDPEDLMHKACGWMLRELGKRCSLKELRGFLEKYAHRMPRTMLRYSIEKLTPSERKKWMNRA